MAFVRCLATGVFWTGCTTKAQYRGFKKQRLPSTTAPIDQRQPPTTPNTTTDDIYGTELFTTITRIYDHYQSSDRSIEKHHEHDNSRRADLAYLYHHTATSAQDFKDICLSTVRGSEEESLTS
jgi:hypothetical protein